MKRYCGRERVISVSATATHELLTLQWRASQPCPREQPGVNSVGHKAKTNTRRKESGGDLMVVESVRGWKSECDQNVVRYTELLQDKFKGKCHSQGYLTK